MAPGAKAPLLGRLAGLPVQHLDRPDGPGLTAGVGLSDRTIDPLAGHRGRPLISSAPAQVLHPWNATPTL